jgi:twitching motility protein PilT
MRDYETVEAALTAAETGHLVLATLHTNSAAHSLDRILGVFPEYMQAQIRMQLSNTLSCVLTQRLLKRKDGKGRVLACEAMMVNNAIRNLIREGKTHQLDTFISLSAKEGSVSMDASLQELVMSGDITAELARLHAKNKENIRDEHFLSEPTSHEKGLFGKKR